MQIQKETTEDLERAFRSAVSSMITRHQAIAHMRANNWTPWLVCRQCRHSYYAIVAVLKGTAFSRPILRSMMALPFRPSMPGDTEKEYRGPIFPAPTSSPAH